MNCWLVPREIEPFTGVTTIETKAAAPTIRLVDEETEPKVAEILAVPKSALVARPFVPELLLTIATVAEDELQVTNDVTSWVLPSA